MTPREFLDDVVRPNVEISHVDFASLRHSYNAIMSVDSLAAHLFLWCRTNAPGEVRGIKDDSHFRAEPARRSPDFEILRDIAKCHKHVQLERSYTQVGREDQVESRLTGFGEGGFGQGRCGGPQQVVVATKAGVFRFIEEVVDGALEFLVGEMQRIGV